LAACGKAPADSGEPPPRSISGQVRFYSGNRLPKCHFTELGYIRESTRIRLKERAFNMGADAVIDARRIYEYDEGGRRRYVGYEGVAIQFTDRGCMY
jgi:hypothetical protein